MNGTELSDVIGEVRAANAISNDRRKEDECKSLCCRMYDGWLSQIEPSLIRKLR